jgi:histidinol-phosphate aminotransferase
MMVLFKAIPGVEPWPSQANFILCRLPQGRGKDIFEGLCRRGIFLRYFGSDRLKDYVRVSIGLPNENDTVVQVLTELVGG